MIQSSKCLWNPNHPLWLAGFRPFFSLAIILGATLPLAWALVYSGAVTWSPTLSMVHWHAHEMLFGFGWAVLGGFLLTASKNWVKVRGIYGWPLMVLVGLWLLERGAVFLPPSSVLRIILLNSFVLGTALYILQTLIIHRKTDSYSDNFLFYAALLGFLIAKNLLIQIDTYGHGLAMTVGLFRLAFAVMFERTMTQFMKSTEGVELPRQRILDYAIKFVILLCALQSFLPDFVAGVLLLVAAALWFGRWVWWRPLVGMRKFGNAVMYLGYLGAIIHLVTEALGRFGFAIGPASLSLHIFTFLCMGLVIPSMLVRIAQGHTGRKPEFKPLDCVAISLIGLAAFARLVLPISFPAYYVWWIAVASVLWSSCYILLGFRLIPFLLNPRIDGKIH